MNCSVVDSEGFFSNPDPTFQLVSDPTRIILLFLMPPVSAHDFAMLRIFVEKLSNGISFPE